MHLENLVQWCLIRSSYDVQKLNFGYCPSERMIVDARWRGQAIQGGFR